MENKRKILMDCDPGIDDAVALALCAAHPEAFRLLGITTTMGNVTLDKTTDNALRLAEYYGLLVPVAAGAAGPVVREPKTASDVHGANGLGNVQFPEAKNKPVPKHAVLFLYETIMELPAGEKVTLVPTGPLTNVGLLLTLFPEVKERIEAIVLMGGSASGGNRTSTAEFNIYVDPEAASIVFSSGVPIVMCGLDATSLCGLDRETAARLSEDPRPVVQKIGQMIAFYFSCAVYRGGPIAATHDAVTFMYMLHPEIFTTEKMPVSVDCAYGETRGMTICDRRKWAFEDRPLVTVLTGADGKRFQELLVESLETLAERLG